MENPEFYVIAHEAGAENPSIPTWACRDPNPAGLDPARAAAVERRDIDGVPGAFQLLGLLSDGECERLRELGERCGYSPDAAVSLGRDIRHNDSFSWIADDLSCDILWHRCGPLLYDKHPYNTGKRALGLNARWRFYRYRAGDYFAPHTDGSWPGSRVIDGSLVGDAYGDRWSQMSMLLFLSEDYRGGATRFIVDDAAAKPAAAAEHGVDVGTPLGAALCFPHGSHPQHCLHASTPVESGSKYIVRSDVLFEL